jgi:hypothetical protein
MTMRLDRALATAVTSLAALTAGPASAQVKIEKVACLGLANCQRLSNGTVEVVVTTDVGPRIIRYALVAGENILGEVPDAVTKTALGDWKAWGGHRLWHAPEGNPRSYAPDNAPVRFDVVAEGTVRLTQPVEAGTGIQKTITVALDATGSRVTVSHALANGNLWAVELAPWALTIMRGGGTAIVPQEPYGAHDQNLLPVRPLVLWAYTDLSDPRFAIGPKYIRLRSDDQRAEPQKIGVGNRQGWAAYNLGRTVFVKRFAHQPQHAYPDFGSNVEVYTAGPFIELESLGPLLRLAPGEVAEHVEEWQLFGNVDVGASEESLDAALAPLVARPAR